MSRLTILSVGFPFATVGPDAVGGSEQVLARLDAAIVASGDRSIVIAPAGSNVAGELVAIPSVAGPVTDEARRAAWERQRQAIRAVLARERVDLVHMHGIDFWAYLPSANVPVIATLHLPPAWYPPEVFQLGRPRTYLNCVSTSQRRACPPCAMLLPEIENGVPVEAGEQKRAKRRFALAMGRICPEKNLHVALDAGARAGMTVLLGGRIFPYAAHVEYFRKQIAPRLDRRRRFAGPIGGERKRRLLATARCLLVPSLAPETSSLVAMEAMACGTPVVAFPSGALTEIVEHGVTGFVVQDEREMADAIEAAGDLDPGACRHAARERFSADAMVEKYFDAYRRLASPSCTSAACGNRPLVSLELLPDIASLDRIREAWSRLWERTPGATPFQSPAWLIPWWRHLGEGQLLTLACRDGSGQLVSLAPMYIYTKPGSNVRELFLLGTGTTDCLGGLFLPGWERLAASAIVRYLASHADRWDVCDWQQLRAGSPMLLAPLPEGWQEQVVGCEPCPVLALPDSVERLGDALPPNVAQNLRYYRRRAGRRGKVEVQRASQDSLEAFYDAFLSLHRKRWLSRGCPGVLDDARVQAAHRDSLPGLLRDRTLRLLALRLDGRIIAALFGLADRERGGRFYYYLGGFDPAFADLSPGTLLIGSAIEQAIGDGAASFDFLRGGEPYKYLWGAKDDAMFRRRFMRTPQ
jgi:CelD/BcsL family acetyltransferase involved in cellulose biosynthesis/glycosyltransferase involved in cell wall biosynthesis